MLSYNYNNQQLQFETMYGAPHSSTIYLYAHTVLLE